jgi:hypothetical protein
MTQRVQHCHKMVRSVAKEAAGQLYETVMGDNKIFEEWKRQNPGASPKQLELRFIERNWGKCVQFARTTLTCMLRQNNIPESVKEEILDALVKDASLTRGRQLGQQILSVPTIH